MSEAEWVTTYTSDETGPNVDDFDLDFDEGLLTLSFDEIVDTATLVPEEVTLLHSGGSFLKLSDVSSLDTEPLRYAQIQIGNDDLNTLKRNYICTLRDECFLSISSSLIRDTSDQTNVAIASGSPLPVSLYTNDSTYPSVVRFTEFDLDQGSFVLEFSETVSSSSVNTDVLEFHNKYVNASHVFTPTESFNDVMDIQSLDHTQILFANAPGSNISYNLYGNYYNAVPNELWDHYHVTFTLTTDNLNAIKINTELATNPNNTYASVTEDVAVYL